MEIKKQEISLVELPKLLFETIESNANNLMTKTTFLVFNNYEDSKQELWKLAFDMIEESGFNTRLVKDDELSRIGFKLFLEINTVVVLEADADLPKAILVLNRSGNDFIKKYKTKKFFLSFHKLIEPIEGDIDKTLVKIKDLGGSTIITKPLKAESLKKDISWAEAIREVMTNDTLFLKKNII